MAFTLEHTSTAQDVDYTLRLTTDEDGNTAVELTGVDAEGTRVAEGSLTLPPGGAAPCARLLTQSLTALSGLRSPRSRKPPTSGNANQRWTAESDAALREAWLSHPPTDPAPEVIRQLASEHERSPAAIRARLARISCDPDVVGRLLNETTAGLVGRGAVPAAAG
ncbi:hypothetical protein [Actinokineospora bangkokensis]|nr:hypothetical protein [Actinokineospora bangkokensis]